MAPSFEAFRDGYTRLWQGMEIHENKIPLLDAIARRLISNKARYQSVAEATSVPWFVIAVIHEREASANFNCHLHNGDSLSARTHHVPANRPPPPAQPPFTWEQSAADALALDGLTKVSSWSVERACYEIELYNGFGYRRRGINSPYLWSFSNNYSAGKFVEDGQWSASAVDAQCGVMPLVKRIMVADPTCAFDGAPAEVSASSSSDDLSAVAATTAESGAAEHSTTWVQQSLNALGATPKLTVDGQYGPSTKSAVRWFQEISGLNDDGMAGPITCAAIEGKLAVANLSQATQPQPTMQSS